VKAIGRLTMNSQYAVTVRPAYPLYARSVWWFNFISGAAANHAELWLNKKFCINAHLVRTKVENAHRVCNKFPVYTLTGLTNLTYTCNLYLICFVMNIISNKIIKSSAVVLKNIKDLKFSAKSQVFSLLRAENKVKILVVNIYVYSKF